jgi:iron(III) transport system permease protein
MLKRISHHLTLFNIITVLAGLLIILPLFNLFRGLFSPPSSTWTHVREYLLMDSLFTTILLILGVAFFSLIIGLFSAYVTVSYDFFGKKLLSWMLILPLAVPSYIAAYIYADMVSYTGTLARFLRWINLPIRFNIMSLGGAIFIFSITLYPYTYMLARSALKKQSVKYKESAKLFGYGAINIFRKVTLPLLRPALVAGSFLVILETLNDYGVVAYFNVRVFSFAIFNAWFNLGDLDSAIRLSSLLLLLVFLIILVERAIRGKKDYQILANNKLNHPEPLKGAKRLLFPILLWVIVGLGFIVPVIQLIYYAIISYERVLRDDLIYIILNTLTITLFASFLVVLIAIFIANFNRFTTHKAKQIFVKISNLGYAIPGAVIAISVNLFFIETDRFLYPIYQWFNPESRRLVLSLSLSMLIFAYVLRFMAIGFNSVESSYAKIGKKYTESAYLLGYTKLQTLVKVDIPLLKHGLIAAYIIVFIDVIKELPLTLILRPANYDTLATLVYEYASDERLQESSLASLILILVSSILIIILTHPFKKEVKLDVKD